MDLRYPGTFFHGFRARKDSDDHGDGQYNNSSRGTGSTLQAAAQLGGDAFEIFGSVASQALRFPIDAANSAANLALHPGEALTAVYDSVRSIENEKLARRTRLLQQICDARSWTEYNEVCAELDRFEGAEVWKDFDHSELYDVECLRGRLKRLIAASDRDDVEEMVDLIRCELTRDLGGMCNPSLHLQTHTGTKFLIDHYIKMVSQVLDRIVH